jgi:hypothetical protein
MAGLVMEGKRKEERLKKENEVTINVVSEDNFIPIDEWSKLQGLDKKDEIPQEGDTFIPADEWSKLQELNKIDENSSQEKIPYNYSKDISMSGAKIQGNILLPIDTIIKIDITLNDLQQKITTIGKVKWNKVIIENESYEAGVEFVDTSDDAIQKLHEQMQKEDAIIAKKDDMKNCRYCSREIKADAEKCEYCGRTLDQRTAKRIFL